MDICQSESQSKRPCCRVDSAEAPACDRKSLAPAEMDHLLEALLRSSDTDALADSLERLMGKRFTDKDKSKLLERSLDLGCRLQDAAKKLSRQRASYHNSVVWPLTHDLTVKVFSFLQTQSICYAAATCTMFYKSALDPACNGDVDLTRGFKISNMTVLKMVQRAGQCFRSLKLGVLPTQSKSLTGSFKHFGSKVNIGLDSTDALANPFQYRNSNYDRRMCILTRSCLDTLSMDNGAAGALLKTLHLFNIDEMDSKALCKAISSCPSLTDLEVVGLHILLKSTLQCISSHCHHLERLCCQSAKTGRTEGLKSGTCVQLVKGCPNISSLALRGFKLSDRKVNILMKGFHQLKFVDFSTAYSVTGTFLRNLAGNEYESSIETLILRDCMRLKEVEVEKFLFALSTGECKCLRLLDISNKDGLAAADWFERHHSPCLLGISSVLLERSELDLVAEFPAEKSCSDSESMLSGFDDSDESGPLQMSLQSSDISSSEFSSDSSYSSDTNSDSDGHGGNDDNLGYQGLLDDDMGYPDLLNNENQEDPQFVINQDGLSDGDLGELQANVENGYT